MNESGPPSITKPVGNIRPDLAAQDRIALDQGQVERESGFIGGFLRIIGGG